MHRRCELAEPFVRLTIWCSSGEQPRERKRREVIVRLQHRVSQRSPPAPAFRVEQVMKVPIFSFVRPAWPSYQKLQFSGWLLWVDTP